MISALLTASLQTMNTLKDVQESIENNTLNKADVNSAFVQNLSPINEKLDKIIEEQQSLSNKITMVEAKTQQTTNKVKEIDENLTVVIQGVTAIISKQNDGKTIISEYESTYLADIVSAIVTTQSNVKTMATALQAINGEIKQMRTEVVDLSDSFVDTTSKVRALELKETTGYTVSEPTSLDDSIAALERFTK
jgi:chromosome segregation ATPase